MKVAEKEKVETKRPAPWYTKSGQEPLRRYFAGTFETKSGAPWYTKQGLNELLWEEGYPKKEEGMAPIYTKTGQEQFWGKQDEKEDPKERGPIKPPLFTKTGWAEMKQKYGTEVEFKAPLYTKTGIKEFVKWGENIQFESVSDAPIYTKSFYKDIGFKVDREQVKQKITVMEKNEDGEEVEVTKEVMVDAPPLPLWFTRSGLGIDYEK